MTRAGVMLPSVSKRSASPSWIIIGNPGSRRVELFSAALAGLNLPPARLISYQDLIEGRLSLAEEIPAGAIVRIESPGKDFEVERLLLKLGAELDEPDGEVYTRLSSRELDRLEFDKGRILPSRQWYLGYCRLLQRISEELAQAAPHRLMNVTADIQTMFDKRACHALLSGHGIPVPDALEPVRSYSELVSAMLHRGWRQVFLKLAHGSSASGVVAYRMDRTGVREQAITTVEMVQGSEGVQLYNSRRIRTYQRHQEITLLIDTLCRQRVHVEAWWPKASYGGKVFDLRVMVIGGQARHCIARLSSSPITNLHLLNDRADPGPIRERIGEQRWQTAIHDCERAARLFTGLYTGADLLFSSDMQRHALLELNAFGDLLPGVLDQKQDTYTAEILTVLAEDV